MLESSQKRSRNRTLRIAIIGGGFTGIAAAITFLRNYRQPAELWLFEPSGCVSGGIAYGEAAPHHLLNVRAQEVSVLPERSNDFLEWCLNRLGCHEDESELKNELGTRFLPRQLLRDYLEDRLDEERYGNEQIGTFFVSQKVQTLRYDGERYHLAVDGEDWLVADVVLLATGYHRPLARHRGGVLGPYDRITTSMAAEAHSVVLLGTGLSMVDAYVSLREAGYQGAITAISRRGMLPEAHEPSPGKAPEMPSLEGLPLNDLVAFLRRMLSDRAARNEGSQAVFNALRHRASRLWQNLTPVEQGRFLRHVKPWWDCYRHRMPSHLRRRLEQDIKRGSLIIQRGRVVDLDPDAGLVKIESRNNCTDDRHFSLEGDIIIDCRGHRPDLDHSAIHSLVEQGLLMLDCHKLGLKVDTAGAAIGPDGLPSASLFALGPLGLGSLFEITGIPEIVCQCNAAIARINKERMASPRFVFSP